MSRKEFSIACFECRGGRKIPLSNRLRDHIGEIGRFNCRRGRGHSRSRHGNAPTLVNHQLPEDNGNLKINYNTTCQKRKIILG